MFKDNLIALRKRAGVSQEELANVIGVSRQSISKYENGTAEPDLTHLAKLKTYFGISYDSLLEGRQVVTESSITGSILIQSAIDGRMTLFDMFKIGTVFGSWRQDSPQVQLVGEMTKNNNGFLGPDEIGLGWYATRIDAEKELQAIQTAISNGQSLYKLQHNVAVVKRGIFGFKMVTDSSLWR